MKKVLQILENWNINLCVVNLFCKWAKFIVTALTDVDYLNIAMQLNIPGNILNKIKQIEKQD